MLNSSFSESRNHYGEPQNIWLVTIIEKHIIRNDASNCDAEGFAHMQKQDTSISAYI